MSRRTPSERDHRKDPRDVVLAPVVSEKSYGLIDEGKYTFLVDPRSNKTEIKLAVEKIFSVKVDSINTINRAGKRKRTKFGWGQRKNTKRAIVTLKDGTIDIFGGPLS
ncbi:50S ribosomal protein L23 [Arthrobacter sp. ATA002]|uniref:50S ribosomal protein L23 n=1 Tax=Arthrobacter sp. ATA002 TaxID=2991715 RepID=UPI0022A807DD|nr:50S ribosomal protein L23 [Arthrobacter sp. ATA002]WAP53294.1 50S ribosomal protein L23 [Arthrobacter sp. ATA002]